MKDLGLIYKAVSREVDETKLDRLEEKQDNKEISNCYKLPA